VAAVPHPRTAPAPAPRRGAAPRAGAGPARSRAGAASTRPGHRPDLRLVAAPRHTGRYLLLGVLLAAVAVFGTVSLGALAAESTFEAQGLDDEVDELSLRYDELTAEVARLESPEHVRGVARAELGMVPAEQPSYLVAEPPEVAAEVPSEEDESLAVGQVTDRVKQAREGRG